MKSVFLIGVLVLLFACSESPQKNDNATQAKEEKKEIVQPEPKDVEVKENEIAPKSESASAAETKVEEEEPAPEPIPKEQIDKAKEIIKAVSKKEVAAVDAKQKYKMFCAACHGFKGNSKVNGAKDLTKSKLPLEESVAQVYHGRGLMTPFKGVMEDAEIVAVAKYIEKELRK